MTHPHAIKTHHQEACVGGQGCALRPGVLRVLAGARCCKTPSPPECMNFRHRASSTVIKEQLENNKIKRLNIDLREYE